MQGPQCEVFAAKMANMAGGKKSATETPLKDEKTP
jgi:hypothetical protein